MQCAHPRYCSSKRINHEQENERKIDETRIEHRKKMYESQAKTIVIVMSKFAKNFVIFTRKLCAFILHTHFITICNANIENWTRCTFTVAS